MEREGPETGRLLGVDLGEKRIGLALGDRATLTAAPLTTIQRGRDAAHDAAVLRRLAAEHAVTALVVGLPFDMSGDEGAQAGTTRAWAGEVGRLTGLPVRFRDERLTSERAERRIGGPQRGRHGGPPSARQRDARRARIDREAATLILQDELDATGAAEATGGDATAAAAYDLSTSADERGGT